MSTLNICITKPAEHEVTAEYDSAMNRLRIADAVSDKTLRVYSDGAIYKVAPSAPTGHVWILREDELPGLVKRLQAAGVVEPVRDVRDSFFLDSVYTLVRVLI